MLYIRINTTDDKYGLGSRVTKDYPQYADEFAKYMAKVIRDELVKAIDNQRYSYKWLPLSLTYVRYKQTHHLSMNTWEATGLLKNSIVYRKRNGYYLVGIDPRARYKNGIKVIDVAKCLEYGTSKMPARPLFRPILTYVRKNIGRYWKKFLREEKGIVI